MSNCRRYQELVEDFLAEEISTEDRADLEEHCAGCAECAGLLELHAGLLALGDEITMPDRHELRDMRKTVLAATTEPRSGFLIDLGKLWRSHPLPTGLATAAVLICMVFLGRWNPQDGSLEDELLRQSIQRSAAQQTGLDYYLDTPFSFANVTVRPQGQGQLALSFDASRHVDMQVAQDSPLAREVLLQAILEPSSMGSRLRAMEVTPQLQDGRLKEALITTMLTDSDPTVRINAMAVLARYPYDQQNQDALLQTLGRDQDVQMRLMAMEELARRNVGMEIIREAVGPEDPNGTMAILHQASISF
ncbi:MAG: zf-HC2 domain-containing protein [Gemmatimonadales bacterium]|nr:zf-HC2 domain-containing protein [Gemmatimonadales bacterium]